MESFEYCRLLEGDTIAMTCPLRNMICGQPCVTNPSLYIIITVKYSPGVNLILTHFIMMAIQQIVWSSGSECCGYVCFWNWTRHARDLSVSREIILLLPAAGGIRKRCSLPVRRFRESIVRSLAYLPCSFLCPTRRGRFEFPA